MSAGEQYLILHKVRGEPAFDVAEQIEMEDEIWWIVSTSGHRAYPAQAWLLESLVQVLHNEDDGHPDYHRLNFDAVNDPKWADLEDHYTVRAGKDSRKKETISADADNLLKALGLSNEPQTKFKRRF